MIENAISNVQAAGNFKGEFPNYFSKLIGRVGMVRDTKQKVYRLKQPQRHSKSS